MSGILFTNPRFTPVNNAGTPRAGAVLYFYQAGTSTLANVYTTSDLSTPHTSPVEADAAGVFPAIYLDPSAGYDYKAICKTSATGSQVWSEDNIPATSTFRYPRTSAEIAAGVTPTDYSYEPGDVRRYGTVGTADDSSVLQSCIDGNKGGLALIPEGVTVTAAGVLLDGAGYNGTRIVVRGTFKLRASGGAANFGGAWVGLIVKDCDSVTLELYDADGNRAAQPASEGVHVVGIAGASNFRAPFLSFREIRGDGIYISQSSWTVASTNPVNVTLGTVHAYNSADDGRNAISVISCTGFSLDSLNSYQVGGTINAVVMPGGLNIEPSQTFHSVTDVCVGSVNATTAGTGGLQIRGMAVTDDATGDWNVARVAVGSFNVRKTGPNNTTVNFVRAFDLQVRGSLSRAVAGNGFELDYLDRVQADLKSYGCSVGLIVGPDGTVRDFDIKAHVQNYTSVGIQVVGANRGRFSGRVYGATSATSTFAIRTRSMSRGITQDAVVYAVDAPYDGANSRAFRNEVGDTVTYGTGTVARDCDWSGYANPSVQCDAQIPSINIRGRHEATAQPSSGAWAAGDFVRRSNPAIDASNMVLMGWIRVTSGTAHVAGTDWFNARVSNVSPAT